jgi:capsular polysaccharide biosynthesis protein
MELKEYFLILKKNLNLFLLIIAAVIVIAFGYFYLRPVSYDTSLTLNISRIGTQETADYRYDDFYRIQADDKFAETVTQWIKSPRIVADIYTDAGINTGSFSLRQLSKSLSPEKLSSQIVSVSFSSPDQKTAKKVSKAVIKIVSDNTNSLNKDQNNKTWFKIVPSEPVTKKYHIGSTVLFLASLLLGIFLGFWIIMLRHYLKD